MAGPEPLKKAQERLLVKGLPHSNGDTSILKMSIRGRTTKNISSGGVELSWASK